MPASTLTVLYIDDDPALSRLMARVLGRQGFVVENVADADAGLARIRAGGIDVVVLDHHLPTGTGLDVLAALAEQPDAPPVVYVTGSAETTIAVQALKAGAVDYVPKTVDAEFLELLGSALNQAVDKARLMRAKERAEQEVRIARDRAETMLQEVNHRVANSLAMIAALVRLQSNAIADKTAKDALAETQARIMAIAGVHRRLYTSHDVRVVQIDDYLRGLAGELSASMRAAGHRSDLHVEAEAMEVPTDRAVPIGVIVTELVTNAFKYAYPIGEAGQVRVRLGHMSEGRARLTVEDDGIGWRGEGKPKGTGLGGRIVKSMAATLGASPAYDDVPRGTRAVLEFVLKTNV